MSDIVLACMYAWLIWMILEIISSIRLGITTGQMAHKNWVRAAGAGARRAPGAALGLAQPAREYLARWKYKYRVNIR